MDTGCVCACARLDSKACCPACARAYRDYIIVHNKYASHPTWCAASATAAAAAAAPNMRLRTGGDAPIRPTNTNNQHTHACVCVCVRVAGRAAFAEDARGPNMCPHTIFTVCACARACVRARAAMHHRSIDHIALITRRKHGMILAVRVRAR